MPPPPPWVGERKSDGSAQARALDLAAKLQRKYVGDLRSGAPPWAVMILHVVTTATAKRIEWAGPLFSMMPYVLHEAEDQRFRVILNRRYKPLARVGHEWVDYELATDQHISKLEFERLVGAGVVTERGYLHDDATTPRESGAALNSYRSKLRAMLSPYLCRHAL